MELVTESLGQPQRLGYSWACVSWDASVVIDGTMCREEYSGRWPAAAEGTVSHSGRKVNGGRALLLGSSRSNTDREGTWRRHPRAPWEWERQEGGAGRLIHGAGLLDRIAISSHAWLRNIVDNPSASTQAGARSSWRFYRSPTGVQVEEGNG